MNKEVETFLNTIAFRTDESLDSDERYIDSEEEL